MRKPLSSGQRWFLSTYFPLIGGILILRSGLRFSFLRQFHDDHIWRKCQLKILRQKWLSITVVTTCMIKYNQGKNLRIFEKKFCFTFHKFQFCSNSIPLSLPSSWSSNTICWPLIDITHCTFDCNGSTFRQRMIPQCLEQHRR